MTVMTMMNDSPMMMTPDGSVRRNRRPSQDRKCDQREQQIAKLHCMNPFTEE
jgi:hypothetical protein